MPTFKNGEPRHMRPASPPLDERLGPAPPAVWLAVGNPSDEEPDPVDSILEDAAIASRLVRVQLNPDADECRADECRCLFCGAVYAVYHEVSPNNTGKGGWVHWKMMRRKPRPTFDELNSFPSARPYRNQESILEEDMSEITVDFGSHWISNVSSYYGKTMSLPWKHRKFLKNRMPPQDCNWCGGPLNIINPNATHYHADCGFCGARFYTNGNLIPASKPGSGWVHWKTVRIHPGPSAGESAHNDYNISAEVARADVLVDAGAYWVSDC